MKNPWDYAVLPLEPKWTGEKVYESFAGPLAKSKPFDKLGPLERRHYELAAKRRNSSDTSSVSPQEK